MLSSRLLTYINSQEVSDIQKRIGKRSSTHNVLTIGIDLGDRWGHYCVLNADGEINEEGRVRMTRTALSAHFTGLRARIAVETGSQSAWLNEHLCSLGHEVIVANTRELRAISGSNSKQDAADAEKLARYARVDPRIRISTGIWTYRRISFRFDHVQPLYGHARR